MTVSTLPPLIQQMMRPEFYPHPVQASISAAGDGAYLEVPEFYPAPQAAIPLIQTHISYVFLTGEYAYKVKKPLNFGFLDFSTLEQRQHFCQEELRLNQRAAATLYLEVVPITQVEQQGAEPVFQLGGTGKVVEYAVKMRQFPQETLLTSLFERGELTESRLQELARVIADFHASTATNDYIRRFGEVAQVRQAFDENYEQTEQYIGGPQTQQQFDETRAYTDRFFAERQALFSSRIQNNWIRECHGDLHLRNICLWNNQFLLFDCIEFNEPFRFVDVMYDIAYIVMDLDARDRPDLKTVFLNSYVEQTGDWDGLQVLPIYISRQTYVRAKVSSFLLNDPNVPAAEKQKAAETAALYYRMAWEYTKPQPGRLILMSGLSGSGKSTIAYQLAKQLGAIQIRSDAVRKHLAGVRLDEWGSADLYRPEMTEKTYGRLLDLGLTLAQQGYTVILDAKYDRQSLRIAAIEQANAHQIPLQILHCDAPLEVLRDRLQQRAAQRLHHPGQEISDATAELLSQQSLEPFTPAEQPFVQSLDTTQDIEDQLNTILASFT